MRAQFSNIATGGMLATAELGRAFYQDNTLTKAVRDGARYLADQAINSTTGVIPTPIEATTQTQAKNLVVYGNIAGTGTPLLPGLAPGQITVTTLDPLHVQVSAAYPYQPIFASLPGFGLTSDISTGITLSAATTMRAL
jgi:Flp pilus assembly protein TadG